MYYKIETSHHTLHPQDYMYHKRVAPYALPVPTNNMCHKIVIHPHIVPTNLIVPQILTPC